ncbi:uncharacterized protein B0H18DRAFT_957742 [Fomitopsis serialis]|uniref:uncharacterized protein n=1 Tax=Fomitopsis serialis TaxID=139415 RepID=UPI0020074B9A|nr:uncharacterized protein B0H18DRAFT_957742 [Neoantrodia serialis]KAH9918981.1 hypothetical protein B0H18DRAFT_957742 [Neoantrodia serialis]
MYEKSQKYLPTDLGESRCSTSLALPLTPSELAPTERSSKTTQDKRSIALQNNKRGPGAYEIRAATKLKLLTYKYPRNEARNAVSDQQTIRPDKFTGYSVPGDDPKPKKTCTTRATKIAAACELAAVFSARDMSAFLPVDSSRPDLAGYHLHPHPVVAGRHNNPNTMQYVLPALYPSNTNYLLSLGALQVSHFTAKDALGNILASSDGVIEYPPYQTTQGGDLPSRCYAFMHRLYECLLVPDDSPPSSPPCSSGPEQPSSLTESNIEYINELVKNLRPAVDRMYARVEEDLTQLRAVEARDPPSPCAPCDAGPTHAFQECVKPTEDPVTSADELPPRPSCVPAFSVSGSLTPDAAKLHLDRQITDILGSDDEDPSRWDARSMWPSPPSTPSEHNMPTSSISYLPLPRRDDVIQPRRTVFPELDDDLDDSYIDLAAELRARTYTSKTVRFDLPDELRSSDTSESAVHAPPNSPDDVLAIPTRSSTPDSLLGLISGSSSSDSPTTPPASPSSLPDPELEEIETRLIMLTWEIITALTCGTVFDSFHDIIGVRRAALEITEIAMTHAAFDGMLDLKCTEAWRPGRIQHEVQTHADFASLFHPHLGCPFLWPLERLYLAECEAYFRRFPTHDPTRGFYDDTDAFLEAIDTVLNVRPNLPTVHDLCEQGSLGYVGQLIDVPYVI